MVVVTQIPPPVTTIKNEPIAIVQRGAWSVCRGGGGEPSPNRYIPRHTQARAPVSGSLPSAELLEAASFHGPPAMEFPPEDHQCGPYCVRACTLDVRPAFEQDGGPEDREGYLVQGGRLAFVGGVNYVNLLSLGYWNQGVVWNHQGHNGGGQEPEQQPAEEPAEEPPEEPGVVAAMVQVQQQQQDPPRRRRQHRKFTAMQLRELEELFQETEYPDLLTRQEIARRLGVSDTRVQIWFKNKRAKNRRNERAAMAQAPPPAAIRRLYFFLADVP
nr:rhox homeobox family member 1-like [Odocoileus virginianus texanus]